ncbi:hypothetical protein EVAR_84424_1 [Eumeta japonica]|uniref:Uncharacterized protein n=1 Tax=Eumeta variegata TaxID=151549 RepID=A0A4C1W1J0_EUMVA|nr:hypothetical protein EVAR_84424_1 [Eumeta japonica]
MEYLFGFLPLFLHLRRPGTSPAGVYASPARALYAPIKFTKHSATSGVRHKTQHLTLSVRVLIIVKFPASWGWLLSWECRQVEPWNSRASCLTSVTRVTYERKRSRKLAVFNLW